MRTIVQVTERDGKQIHARSQVGFSRGELRSTGAVCTGDAAACEPVIASLKLESPDLGDPPHES